MPELATEQDAPAHRYEAVAGFITSLVESGTLRAGMRAPSLRKIAAQHKASMSTVLQAYRLLEDRGILEARPKSGFYVTASSTVSLETPAVSSPPTRATPVKVSGGILEILENAANPDLVPLGCAIPSADLLAAGRLDRFLARAARMRGADYNIYTEPRGDPGLRGEIARRALRWGQAISPEDIAITCGCTEALSLALRVVARPGDTVAIESPSYFGLLQVLEAQGLKALELPTDSNDGIEIDALEKALKTRSIAACLLSSSFNNPLGFAMNEARKRQVLDVLRRHEVPLIEDDIYGDIYFGGERPKPFSAIDPDADVIYCSSFSKTVAPGYRIGWIVSPRHIGPILEEKFALTLCGPALPQAAMAEFLSSGGFDSHLRRVRRVFADHIDRMTRTIGRSFPETTRITRPAGGFVLWLEMPEGFDSRQLFETALKAGISIAPGDIFTATDRYRNCIRLSCGHAWGDWIEQGLEELGGLVNGILSRSSG